MTANEIRIGNHIEIDQYPNDRAIVLIENGADIDGCIKLNPKPIPLTEELLLKLGFIKGDYNWFRLYFEPNNVNDSDCFTYNINSKMLCLESFYDGEKKGSIQVLGALGEKYLHHLQNLYFALTNEELTFKTE